MMDFRTLRRYSEALFQLAQQRQSLDTIDDQLLAVRELVEKHHEISNLVSNSTISQAEKEDFIGKIVPVNTLSMLVNFLKVLIKKKRFGELPLIQEEFHRLYEKKGRVEAVTVVCAVALSRNNASKLEAILEKKLRSDIKLIEKIDPKMIGGLLIQFGGQEINASFRSQLEELYQRLTMS